MESIKCSRVFVWRSLRQNLREAWGQAWSSRVIVWRSLRQVSDGAVGPWCEGHSDRSVIEQ